MKGWSSTSVRSQRGQKCELIVNDFLRLVYCFILFRNPRNHHIRLDEVICSEGSGKLSIGACRFIK